MRVWVTRDEETVGPLSTALRAAGLTVVHEPVLARRVVNDAADTISQLGSDRRLRRRGGGC
jgi:uroporphyrinogen-III synthase